MTTATKIGEHGTAQYDGLMLTLEHRNPGEHAQVLHFEPFEVIQLLRFVDEQAALFALKWETLRREARETVNPKWQYCAQYKCWRYMVGEARIELAPRPSYCDRGRWVVTETGVGDIDRQDEFPRYFMDLTRAMLEMQEWLDFRMRDYADSDHKRFNNVANKLRDVRDSIGRLVGELNPPELDALASAYLAIQDRLAPNLDASEP